MSTREDSGSGTTDRSPFDLSGGRACLDLANTLEDRLKEPRDRLRSYADLVSWAQAAGVLDSAAANAFRKEARKHPADAQRALATARALRETFYAVFTSVAGGRSPSPAALDALNEALPGALGTLRLAATRDGFEWRWALGAGGMERVLAPVVRDAAELLTSGEVQRVRVCESETCAWLFLDQSRNRSRRWCDMSVCGNRAKARRYYERSRSEE